MRLINAHLGLLKAELAVTGREIGIIIALAIGALSLALLIVTLLYTGTWLFLGEWLFGSIGWASSTAACSRSPSSCPSS